MGLRIVLLTLGLIFAASDATSQSPTAVSRAVALVQSVRGDLRLLDKNKGRLTDDERKQRDHVEYLLRQTVILLNERPLEHEMEALSLVTTAANEVGALVRRLVNLDVLVQGAEQYRAGNIAEALHAGTERYASDLDDALVYIEHNRDRLGVADTPLSDVTVKTLAAACLLETEVAFQGPSDPRGRYTVARRLLDAAGPAALPPRFAERWSIAVIGHLHGEEILGDAMLQADAAVKRFPREPDILVAAGAFWEMLGAHTFELPPPRMVGVENKSEDSLYATYHVPEGELYQRLVVAKDGASARAERLYRRALAAQPGHAEAHLRLGRLLALAGRRDAALQELGRAAASPVPRIHYLASMFEGSLHETAGRTDRAIACYQTAQRTCPGCLSSGVALSRAEWRRGNREEAVRTLDAAMERDAAAGFDDYWWAYALGARWQRDALMTELRSAVR